MSELVNKWPISKIHTVSALFCIQWVLEYSMDLGVKYLILIVMIVNEKDSFTA